MLVYQAVILMVLLAIAALVRRNHADYRIPPATPVPADAPLVSILVPARNEAANIEACLRGLLAQSYSSFEVLVLDDGSTDETAARVRALAGVDLRLRLLSGGPLPDGWAGKAHACAQLARAARGEWFLFVDADTRHEPELLARAFIEAHSTDADLLSTFPRQEIGSVGEALTVPFIFWVLFTLLPIRGVWERPEPALVAACGQFLLVRHAAYEDTSGHGAIPASLHDGLHLARLFKKRGKRVRLADLSPWIKCRMYRGWRECWAGFTRNSYQALGSIPALAVVVALESGLFLGPFASLAAALVQGWPRWGWLVAGQVAILFGIQISLWRRFRYGFLTVLLHPVGIAALISIQVFGAWKALSGVRSAWKGRTLLSGQG